MSPAPRFRRRGDSTCRRRPDHGATDAASARFCGRQFRPASASAGGVSGRSAGWAENTPLTTRGALDKAPLANGSDWKDRDGVKTAAGGTRAGDRLGVSRVGFRQAVQPGSIPKGACGWGGRGSSGARTQGRRHGGAMSSPRTKPREGHSAASRRAVLDGIDPFLRPSGRSPPGSRKNCHSTCGPPPFSGLARVANGDDARSYSECSGLSPTGAAVSGTTVSLPVSSLPV
jgi:hypothetical protein